MSVEAAARAASRLLARARPSAARAAFPAALAAAVVSPLAIHWLAGRTLVWFDTARLYAPQRWLVDEALRAFRLPLWNPFMGGGRPFLADAIHGVLHPVSILTAWLGTGRSADVLIGAYVALAGVGAALLARGLGASRPGAATAGFAYGLSGFVLSMAGNLVFLAGAASLPFCVAGLRRFAAEPRPATLAFGVAGAGVLALSGDVQALLLGGALGVALAWEAAGWRGAARAAFAAAVGLLVAGVQLVPSAVHLYRSVRRPNTWSPPPEIWALEPWRLPELVIPGLLQGRDPVMDALYEGLAGPQAWIPGAPATPFTASIAVGLLPAALAVVGLASGRRARLLGAIALMFAWIALGPALGASQLLGRAPIWGSFRYSEKLVGPLTLVVALLAALGADALAERRAPRSRVLVAAAALALASFTAWHLETSALAPGLARVADARALRGLWHVLGAGVALAGAIAADRLGVVRARVALPAIVWAGMAAASGAALRPGDPAARLDAPGPALAASSPGPRILTPYTYEPMSLESGAERLDASIRDHASKGYAAHNVGSRLDSLDDYSALAPRGLKLLSLAFGARWPEAARRYAATHVVVAPPRTEEHQKIHQIATQGGTRLDPGEGETEIWAIPHREWASFPAEVRVVADVRAAGFETARTFIQRSPAVVVEAPQPLGAAPGNVLRVERGLETVRIEAEAAADATLVVADAWWPGWQATLDGAPVPVFRADVLVRAVPWPAGRHVLELRYLPPEVEWGVLVSLLGVVAGGAWAWRLRRHEPHRPAPEQG